MPLLIEELLNEAFNPRDYLVLEIDLPGTVAGWGREAELDDVGKRIERCLQKLSNQIPGIRQTTVKGYKDAEIVLELQLETPAQVTLNRNKGNAYRDAVGEALKQCSNFKNIQVEGAKKVDNRIDTVHGPRYVDIRMTDTKTGKPVNIELKRGDSRYHHSQRKKDGAIASQGKGTTYVVRGEPGRRKK